MPLQISRLPIGALGEARELLERACEFDAAGAVAEEKLFGEAALGRSAHPLAAFQDQRLLAVASCSDRWLRLLAVDPDARGQGVGSALLSACEAHIARQSPRARTMDQPGNYLSPGIDERNQATITWLGRRGYQPCARACNLLIDVQGNPRVSAGRARALRERVEGNGYQLLRLLPGRLRSDAESISRAFSPGWAFEVRRAATARVSGVHIAIDASSGQLAAFAAHDGNNRGLGWFGPTGTFEAHRGKGIGAALLLSCLVDVQEAGLCHSQVAWIGPRDFYEKVAGIDSERHFTVMSKELHD